MRKFKLIKEYPGSFELGTIVIERNVGSFNKYFKEDSNIDGLSSFIVEKHSEYFEEIIEKEYEILQIQSTVNDKIRSYDGELEKDYRIYSVRRLSDNEIFTIGDNIEIDFSHGVQIIPIDSIRISIYNDNIGLCGSLKNKSFSNYPLKYAKKSKQKLFTTEDGIDIYENDKYYSISSDYNLIIIALIANGHDDNDYRGKRFSTKEAAEKYIIENKPCLSINDIKNNYNGLHGNLEKLVKSRL